MVAVSPVLTFLADASTSNHPSWSMTVTSNVDWGLKSRITWYVWPRRRELNLYQIVPLATLVADAVQVTGVPMLAGAGTDGVSATSMAEAHHDGPIKTARRNSCLLRIGQFWEELVSPM
jgi:hypothetical protein